jgi:hypothetical protein
MNGSGIRLVERSATGLLTRSVKFSNCPCHVTLIPFNERLEVLHHDGS